MQLEAEEGQSIWMHGAVYVLPELVCGCTWCGHLCRDGTEYIYAGLGGGNVCFGIWVPVVVIWCL